MEIGTFEKKADKAYMFDSSLRIYADEGTVIFQAIDDDELDPGVIGYDDFEKMEFAGANAVVFGKAGKTADMIVFVDDDFDAVQKDVYFGVVTDDAWNVGGNNWKTEIDVFGEGKDAYPLKTAGDRNNAFKKGSLVAFRLDSNDKVYKTVYRALKGAISGTDADDESIVTGRVYDVDGSFIEIDGTDAGTYKVKSGAVIYVTKDNGAKLDGTLRLTRIDDQEEVYLLLDEDKEVAAMLVIR